MSDDPELKKEADQRTFIALVTLLFVAGLLLALTALVLPTFLGIVLVVGGIGMFGVFHYVIWGWWLAGYLNRHSDSSPSDD
jgi:hypothetical protein